MNKFKLNNREIFFIDGKHKCQRQILPSKVQVKLCLPFHINTVPYLEVFRLLCHHQHPSFFFFFFLKPQSRFINARRNNGLVKRKYSIVVQ